MIRKSGHRFSDKIMLQSKTSHDPIDRIVQSSDGCALAIVVPVGRMALAPESCARGLCWVKSQ